MESRFIYRPQLRTTDIDQLNHVNNEVYLRWLIEAAVAHSAQLGFTLEQFFDLGAAFVVRRHELDYLRPVMRNEVVRVETWTMPFEGSRAVRHYEIMSEKNQKVVLAGKTLWVYVDLQTGRPAKIPDLILEAFKNFRPAES